MKTVSKFKELSIEKLRWHCKPDTFGIKTTDELKSCPDIIGQQRAVNALRLGLDIESLGYNIFVTGKVGTGRKTAVRNLLRETERYNNIPEDKCYVNNFKNPDEPILIRLKAGEGRNFKKDLDEFVTYLTKHIPAIFESKEYEKRRKEIVDNFKAQGNAAVSKFEKLAAKENFALIQVQVGPITKPEIVPLVNGKPVNFAQLNAMAQKGKIPKEELAKLEKKYAELSEKLDTVLKETREFEKAAREKLRKLNYEIVSPLIEQLLADVKQKYKNDKIDKYLDEVKEDVIEHLDKLRKGKEKEKFLLPGMSAADEPFLEYRVNVIVDNHGAKRAPVIFETSPTYRNLFGTVEVVPEAFGRFRTDFTRIKAGSLLRADGGFLVIDAWDALIEPGVWYTLKRTLKNRKIEIQNYSPYSLISAAALKPEPIECDAKVVMVGDNFLYHLLYHRDEDFKKIFKVRADFDSVMDVSKETIAQYCNFIKKIIAEEKLAPFDKNACASIVEWGVRLAGRQTKISTQFNMVADVMREAHYWAKKESRKTVTDKHVDKAIEEKIERSRLIEEKIQELIEDGTIMIDTKGEVVGQVNGLSVYDTGEYAFGKPSRITAKASVGSSGIINIEREAELSGRIHNKGVLILSGYLRSKYAQDKPLAMSASLCFEQSYGGVEGDSASSTEIYALLSALSGLPLRQDIAVTGSVNQKGEIQAIGGVNQKIEGFYDVCKAKGLTGTQGVMIPTQNVNDLMLRQKVIAAVKKGKFHIYPIKTINQGIEILTGVKTGKIKKDGTYSPDTVNGLVDNRLREFAEHWKKFRTGEKEKKVKKQ